jgi:predicted neutral ceramidase superfamily lipid hydrolase
VEPMQERIEELKYKILYVIFSVIMVTVILIVLLGVPVAGYIFIPSTSPILNIIGSICLSLVWWMLLVWIDMIIDIETIWLAFNIRTCIEKFCGISVDLNMNRFNDFHLRRLEIEQWLKENCKHRWWWTGYAKYKFISKAEAMRFRLVWN